MAQSKEIRPSNLSQISAEPVAAAAPSTVRVAASATFDTIVIGAGLSGLIAARTFEQSGRRVALFEGHDSLGGQCRAAQTLAGATDHSLKFLPECDDADALIAWLESLIAAPIERRCIEEPPVTFDDGKFKPFIGFGDAAIRTASEVSAYARSRYFDLSLTPKDWMQRLAACLTTAESSASSSAGNVTVFTRSIVTRLEIENDAVARVVVNGSKVFAAKEVVFCGAPQDFVKTLPDAAVAPRFRQRLAKGDFFTSINLELIHAAQVTESRAVHILKGANEEPSLGLFHPAQTLEDGRRVQVSQWLTLVPRDITDEAEHVAAALKQIKRQIKRAYETSLDGLIKERIVVSPNSHGDLTNALPEDGKWPKLDNLWLCTGLADDARNVWGSLRQAHRTLSAMGALGATATRADQVRAEPERPGDELAIEAVAAEASL